MDVEAVGDVTVDEVQEPPELFSAVTRREIRDDIAGGDVERRVQVGGAVADVVMGPPLGRSWQQRKHWRGAIQCLDLALLVDTQHDCRVGRVHIQTHDITDLIDELRIR